MKMGRTFTCINLGKCAAEMGGGRRRKEGGLWSEVKCEKTKKLYGVCAYLGWWGSGVVSSVI